MGTMNVLLKDTLYSSRIGLSLAPTGWATNMEKSGVASRYNSTRGQKAKLSNVAYIMEKLIKKEISVSNIPGNATSYIEYHTSSGELYTGTISFDTIDAPMIEFSDFRKASGQNQVQRLALAFYVSAMICNEEFKERCKGVSAPRAQSVEDIVKNFTEIKSVYDNAVFKDHCLADADVDKEFLICDEFYYQFGKTGIVNVDNDDNTSSIAVSRVVQSSTAEHVIWTAAPSALKTGSTKKKATKKENSLFDIPLNEFFEKCKNGDFVIDYPWDENQKKLIVPLDFLDTFIPTETFREQLIRLHSRIEDVLGKLKKNGSYTEIMGRNPINVKILGKPGTGKTTMIEAMLASLGYPKGIINCKGNMEEDDIEGLNKFINGSVYGIPTKVGELHSVGGAIILEEANLPSPDVLMGSLGQALVYPFILKQDGYIECKRHPLTIYFATMNIGTNGSKPLNEALSSRFPEGCILEDVTDDEFLSILCPDGKNKTAGRKVYKTYKAILNYLRQYNEDLVRNITMRHCIAALDNILNSGFTEKRAYKNTFLVELYGQDPEIAADVEENVLKLV